MGEKRALDLILDPHHRSEVATMLTMISGSPPATDLVVYQLIQSGQMA